MLAPALRHSPDALYVQEGAEDIKLALLRILRLVVLGFRSRLPLLPDQGCQGLTERKLVSDRLDDVLQFIFATCKGAFFGARRNCEIERVEPD